MVAEEQKAPRSVPQPGENGGDHSIGARFLFQPGPVRPCTCNRRHPESVKIEHMFLAGVPVPDRLVLELARQLGNHPLAAQLEDANGREIRVFGLTEDDRDAIILALDDPDGALAELRGVLLRERSYRRAEGL